MVCEPGVMHGRRCDPWAKTLILLLVGGCSARTVPLATESGATAGSTGSGSAGSVSSGENTSTTADGFGQLTTACGESQGGGDGPTAWRPTEGCPAAWPYSKIRGPSPDGAEDFDFAMFGYTTYFPGEGESYSGPQLRFFKDGVDYSMPHLNVWELAFAEPKAWLGEYMTKVHRDPGDAPGSTESYDAIVEICSFAGNWQAYDPSDPPRLLGQIRAQGSGYQGTFDAVFCDGLYYESWPD